MGLLELQVLRADETAAVQCKLELLMYRITGTPIVHHSSRSEQLKLLLFNAVGTAVNKGDVASIPIEVVILPCLFVPTSSLQRVISSEW